MQAVFEPALLPSPQRSRVAAGALLGGGECTVEREVPEGADEAAG